LEFLIVKTKTDVGAADSPLKDEIIRFRVWGKHTPLKFPKDGDEWTIGTAATCSIQIREPDIAAAHSASAVHARLRRFDGRLLLRDLSSKNGTWLDGGRRDEIELAPGVEIAIGRVTLIAESERSIALREFLGRVIGWTDEKIEDIDLALRAVRATVTRRAPLLLYGRDDLITIALGLHRLAFGSDKPFVVCDPRRVSSDGTARAAQNFASAVEGLAFAVGGSLCAQAKRLPEDFAPVQKALAKPDARAQLIIVGRQERDVKSFPAAPIGVPSLSRRDGEIDRIVRAYADDAVAEFGAQVSLSASERALITERCAKTLGEIEKATRRAIAVRHGGNLGRAATLLGMTRIALKEWLESHGLPLPKK
jgi:hypothetical protein